MPRTRTAASAGVSTSSCRSRMVPAASVPVTTVPLPLMLNARSTQSRTGASRSGLGRRPASRPSASVSCGRPAPLTALTATASTWPRLVAAMRSRAWRIASAGSARSARVTTSRPWLMPRACTAARCSSDCGIQPSSAATVNSTAGTGPTPASMLGTKRSCPGTSTNASRSPEGSVSQQNPRSMVRPRRRSSAHRSGSIPVSARTRVDLPWSTCPAVAITCMVPGPSRPAPRRPAGRPGRAAPPAGRAAAARPRSGRPRPGTGRCAPAGRPATRAASPAGRLTAALGSGTPGAPPPPTTAVLVAGRASSPAVASRLASCRARRASDGSSAASAVASGTGGPVSVASSAAAVVLSTRSARASGCLASWRTRAAWPKIRPACGPPSSLSPLAVTSAAPACSQDPASGSSGSSGCRPSRPDPMSASTGTPSVASSATPTWAVKPSTRKFDGCTLSTNPVSGPQALS